MARPTKQGLDYFPLDVDIDQDDKIQLIEALHGIIGFGVVIKLLMRIYREGYYYRWSEMEQILFSKRVNVDINMVVEIVNDCIKYSIFNEMMYESHGILTSQGIQSRYFEATKRRKEVEANSEYLLINVEKEVNVNMNRVNVNINSQAVVINDDISTQSKVYKSIEEDIKENSRKKTYDVDSPPYKLADFFVNEISKNDPKFKKPNMQVWSDDVRKMLELDDRDKKEVGELMRWVQQDEFERANVLSPSKLRKRYTALILKMKEPKYKKQEVKAPVYERIDTSGKEDGRSDVESSREPGYVRLYK